LRQSQVVRTLTIAIPGKTTPDYESATFFFHSQHSTERSAFIVLAAGSIKLRPLLCSAVYLKNPPNQHPRAFFPPNRVTSNSYPDRSLGGLIHL
jgi:hypothetical protein